VNVLIRLKSVLGRYYNAQKLLELIHEQKLASSQMCGAPVYGNASVGVPDMPLAHLEGGTVVATEVNVEPQYLGSIDEDAVIRALNNLDNDITPSSFRKLLGIPTRSGDEDTVTFLV
jgi:hypothetical protein